MASGPERAQQIPDLLVDRVGGGDGLADLLAQPALVLPPQSVRLAFRALRTEDLKLRGVALEYLDSVLPHALREQLSARMEGQPPVKTRLRPEEALANLMESSPSIVARLEELGFEGR